MIKKLKLSALKFENMKKKISNLANSVKQNQLFQRIASSSMVNMDELASLTKNQIQELERSGKFFENISSLLQRCFSLTELVDYYKDSKEKWIAINWVTENYWNGKDNILFQNAIINARNLDEVDSICSNFIRNNVLYGNDPIVLEEIPKRYQETNADILFLNISERLLKDYYKKNLTLFDILESPDEFKKIPTIENFLNSFGYDTTKRIIIKRIGTPIFIELLKKYPDTIEHIISVNPYLLSDALVRLEQNPFNTADDIVTGITLESLEKELKRAIREDIVSHTYNQVYYSINGNYDWDFKRWNFAPEWMRNLFTIVPRISGIDELMEYNDSTIVLDKAQEQAIEMVGIQNIKRLQQETNLFSFIKLNDFLSKIPDITFTNKDLTYEEVCYQLLHDSNRRYLNYFDWSFNRFYEQYPEIFLEESAPPELKKLFYETTLFFQGLYNHKEYIPYLKGKDFINAFNQYELKIEPIQTEEKHYTWLDIIKRIGRDSFLELSCEYGEGLIRADIHISEDDFADIEKIKQEINDCLYQKITTGMWTKYRFLKENKKFSEAHPDLFINLEELEMKPEIKERIENLFYKGKLFPEIIQKYPELIPFLKEKNLKLAFHEKYAAESYLKDYDKERSLYQLENEVFLKLCEKYGRYIENITIFQEYRNVGFEELCKKVEAKIKEGCYNGEIDYQETDAPFFLKEECKDLFLEEDAPHRLKNYFYCKENIPLSFEILQEHPEWLTHLEGKSVKAAMLRKEEHRNRLKEFFEIFGEKALSIGIQKQETISKMIEKNQLSLMEKWYLATGKRFIPDFVVMENFPIEEVDRYLETGWLWNRLMKIEDFSKPDKAREAMLKMAYALGMFESSASKKEKEDAIWKPLKKIFMDPPKKIDASYAPIMEELSKFGKVDFNTNQIPEVEVEQIIKIVTIFNLYEKLKEAMEKEGLKKVSEEGLLEQIYQKNKDGSYSLRINAQSYPLSCKWMRKILEQKEELPILTPKKAGEYFTDFDIKYQSGFREFFLRNYESILMDKRYLVNISKIQCEFAKIECAYKSNNKKQLLSIDFACRQVEKNRFKNINAGNEQAASEVAKVETNNYLSEGKRCYSQLDWDELQEIYNEGKQRVTSSIPRVESKKGEYSYEILRLDDCLALTIGDRSDCCQGLHMTGESCMRHSMTSKHGRIFVVRDELGTIVAQSWVWRNMDVLCFDNIEVPDKQMYLHGIKKGEEDHEIRNQFTDEVLAVYQQAAKEILEEDARMYQELLEKGQITEEQYEKSRLRKITTGEGFSNILGSLKTLPQDAERTRPIPEGRSPYSDACIVQYILAENSSKRDSEIKRSKEDTLTVFYDSYKEQDDKSFNETMLETLINLELITKRYSSLSSAFTDDYDSHHIVTSIAENYELDPAKTRIILHPNFAIVYEKEEDKVVIGDLLFNTQIKNGNEAKNIEDIVLMQMSLALDQIIESKEVDLHLLNEEQKKMYQKARKEQEELEIERGIHHAR
ncbi:MAG: hypothetical protein IJI60_01680 [Bacilli bacterium]|nr:hypothetical protein [Bacilli bacterium]